MPALQKLLISAFRWNFVSFFCVYVLDIISKLKTKTAIRNKMLIKFYISQ